MSSRWISISLRSGAASVLDRSVAAASSCAHRLMHRLHQRTLAHAPRAPEQRVVGGQTPGEAPGVGQQRVAHALDGLEQLQRHPVDALDRQERLRFGLPDERLGPVEGGGSGRRRRQPFERGGDARRMRSCVRKIVLSLMTRSLNLVMMVNAPLWTAGGAVVLTKPEPCMEGKSVAKGVLTRVRMRLRRLRGGFARYFHHDGATRFAVAWLQCH